MGITKTEELEDRVRVHYTLFQYYSEYNKPESIDVLYDSIPNLPKVPIDLIDRSYLGTYEFSDEAIIDIKKISRSIKFIIIRYEEHDQTETDRSIHGPFQIG